MLKEQISRHKQTVNASPLKQTKIETVRQRQKKSKINNKKTCTHHNYNKCVFFFFRGTEKDRNSKGDDNLLRLGRTILHADA